MDDKTLEISCSHSDQGQVHKAWEQSWEDGNGRGRRVEEDAERNEQDIKRKRDVREKVDNNYAVLEDVNVKKTERQPALASAG